MSEETARKLKEARDEEARCRTEINKLGQQLIAGIAQDIPSRLDEKTKKVVHGQPEVSRELGAAGIKTLRTEVAKLAGQHVAEVQDAASGIEWPRKGGHFSDVQPRDIERKLYGLFSGRRANAIAAVFKSHGFNVQDDNAQRAQCLISGRDFYSDGDTTQLAEALNALWAAEQAASNAKKEDDHDVVEALWED